MKLYSAKGKKEVTPVNWEVEETIPMSLNGFEVRLASLGAVWQQGVIPQEQEGVPKVSFGTSSLEFRYQAGAT
ncbi:hypothetical protein J41TS12_27180 [Paenibacillus antibioticophila]|uniref:Uncharacterized protein n=1 Tax=Paenibacillus antibioticophila TaxID=1274374 RepID=A0A920CII2_9BACL|nr:hypothetical protein [Paenibacillus antibioticophila]GIO37857.1 hypothetical protein J41TS12_27180 [Paenibacillus antibioticophila]